MIGKFIGGVFALMVVVAALVFYGIYLIIKGITIFLIRWLHTRSAAKYPRG